MPKATRFQPLIWKVRIGKVTPRRNHCQPSISWAHEKVKSMVEAPPRLIGKVKKRRAIPGFHGKVKVRKIPPGRNLWIWKVKSSLVFHGKRSRRTAIMVKAVKKPKVTPRRNL